MKRDVPHFRIGLLLTEAGILDPRALDVAIEQAEQEGLPFLRVLTSTGSLRQQELQAVVRAQSLIWSGLLDVDRAIRALSIVHTSDISFEDGLRSIGWVSPTGAAAESAANIQRVRTASHTPTHGSNGHRQCQYCATLLSDESSVCAYCTGDNSGVTPSLKARIQPQFAADASPAVPQVVTAGAGAQAAAGALSKAIAAQRFASTEGTPSPAISQSSESSARHQNRSAVRITACDPPRDPVLMAFLSGCCLPGCGQLLCGQAVKGICLIVFSIAIAMLTKGFSLLIFNPLTAIDAYLLADKLKSGRTVGPWDVF